ncbi:peptide chain release factor N(5)-glutamine methyltransferase [Larkinella rosea]|uniref:Release factor glutamine methyltransferase n=1 Tax=Larkinella rosea TaxID=2025312 RepID=A0A3P1BUR6_9BACT|nr:peptide chain release factor N(5)-glutamine methyltransferase [Larkinella rosea]RRB04855.1 peptide chain release factor N(5)-glutamine methyltransferase [Larkinella rosea]
MLTAKSLFDSLVGQLKGYRPEEARAIVFLLLEHYLLLRRTDVVAGKPVPTNPPQPDWDELIQRLNNHEPVQHLIGTTEFCGLEFQVSPAVLIPRPETEELIRLIVRDYAETTGQLNMIDIGTGSGCIAVTLARFLPQASVVAWDLSPEALEVAQLNAQTLLADVEFEQRDILNVGEENRLFECVVSNPPYVTLSEAEHMETNVLRYEPHLALFVEDQDPLLFYKAVADFGQQHLSIGGACFVEINERFGPQTQQVFEERNYHNVQIFKDIHGKERFVKAVK